MLSFLTLFLISKDNMLQALKQIMNRLFCLDHKFLLLNLIRRNLKVRYRQSVGGMLWTLLIPICTAMVFYFVFKFYMRIQADHYLGLIISGIIPWGFVSSSLSMGTESLVNNSTILSKVPVRPNVFPLTENMTNFINSFLGLPVIFGALLIDGVSFSSTWLAYPLLLIPLFLIVYSMTYLLSLAFVFLRDLRHFLQVILQMAFYLTPIVYPYSMVPERYLVYFYLNPVAGFFIASQDILIQGKLPSFESVFQLTMWTVIMLVISSTVAHKFQGEVIENL
jgi:lipopolysaccharide transport system permease protein